jgi:hypothetical protein
LIVTSPPKLFFDAFDGASSKTTPEAALEALPTDLASC